VVAAAAFSGFYQRAGFQDDVDAISARRIMDGSAVRPFVYRRLDPMIANLAADAAPDWLQQAAWRRLNHKGTSAVGPNVATTDGPRFFIAYNVLFYLAFAQLLASLFVLRALLSRFVGPLAATITPALWALLIPIIEAVGGGHFYDFPEQFFLSAAVLSAVDGRIARLALWTVLGTLNKESFLVFIPSLIPFLAPRMRLGRLVATTGALMTISALIYGREKFAYRGNGGFDVDFNLFANLRFYLNPLNLLKIQKAYGLALPRAWSVCGIAAAAAVVAASWSRADPRLQRHLLIAAAFNLPLFILFAGSGEVRNLSLCFVGFAGLLAYAVDGWIRRTAPVAHALEQDQLQARQR
jgi:hypothetical protein